MAPELPSFVFLLSLLLLPLLSHTTSSDPLGKTPLAFDFLKHLQGCHKGDKTKGINDLKKYLKKFGYLSYNHSNHKRNHANDDLFDDLLESAVKSYQLYYHLKVTGRLDDTTISKMSTPRCGMADVISEKKRPIHRGLGLFRMVSRYSYFPRSPKWSKAQLTYAFLPDTRTDAMGPVGRAFHTWASVINFTFTCIQDHKTADITISFERKDHGDGNPFDGAGGILAHAYAPEDGRFHYDADESWGVGATPGAFDLETVALHEIGHLLGLDHSSVEDAIMYAYIESGATKSLHRDDIQGIKALYNVAS